VFLGVPYAAPPIGPRRWQAPERLTATWSSAAHTNTTPPAPPQPTVGTSGGATLPGLDADRTDEDCLYLNVWAPADASNAPVMVWIPGGAFVTGGAGIPLYDGERLASRQQVMVVSVTYRVGALGFAAVPDCPPNRGLLDQVAALQWVQENVAALGGDPANVTVFGESAGGGSVLHLMAMPSARGLFRRAVVQSGATDYTLDIERAGHVATRFLEALNHDTAAPVERLLAAQDAALLAGSAEVGPMPFHPFVDGDTLPAKPLAALPSSDVDLLIGTTRDEMRMFLDARAADLDHDQLVKRTARYLTAKGTDDGDAAAVVALYDGDPRLPTPGDAWSAIQTDGEMRRAGDAMASAHTSSAASTFVYRFDEPLCGRLANLWACHASDLPYPFGTVDLWPDVTGPAASNLSNKMQAAWVAFARNGDPSCAEIGEWAPYESSHRATMLLAAPGCRVERDPDGARRAHWATVAPLTP
jgi:para-nitrobenzyl esterase